MQISKQVNDTTDHTETKCCANELLFMTTVPYRMIGDPMSWVVLRTDWLSI